MRAALTPTTVKYVDSETGQSLRSRRVALGISVRRLAERAGIDRSRITAIEAGDESVRETTIGAVESALSKLEHEMGMDVPDQGTPIGDPAEDLIEIAIDGNFGVRAVVKGPVRDLPALQDAVSKIIADMQRRAEVREQD